MNSLWPEQDGNELGETGLMRPVGRSIAGLLLALASACATLGPAPEAVVRERAQARWNALVQGDVKAAYEYFSPGSRATSSLADFASGIRLGFWKAVTVDKVVCSTPDRCEVDTTIEYDRGMRIKTPHRETWVREGSNWWFLRR